MQWILPTATDIERQPVKVRIYVESLCIDSQRYMYDQILPTYYQLQYGRSTPIMDLQIIMFGNAHYVSPNNNNNDNNNNTNTNTNTTLLICQHGIAECDANRYHLCVQSLYENNIRRYLPYMACLYDGRIPMGYHNTSLYPSAIFAACAKETGILWSFIQQQCYHNDTMIQELQRQAYRQTYVTNHTYVPWVTLNDQHLMDEDMKNLTFEIWQVYQSSLNNNA